MLHNYGLGKEDKDLASYQLYPYILDLAGIHEGLITKYHQQSGWQEAGYTEGLTMLAYDLLYGENYAYNGINPFSNSKLKMGIDKISVTDVEEIPGMADGEKAYLVTGTGFTQYAQVYFDGSLMDTEWIDSHHLKITENLDFEPEEDADAEKQEKTEEDDIDETGSFTIKILDDDGVILSTSKPLLYKKTSLPVNDMQAWN